MTAPEWRIPALRSMPRARRLTPPDRPSKPATPEVTGATSTVAAAQATVERIQSELDDSTLKAPRSGRVQYRLAQPGEMLSDGGKVLNLIDLSDVYMSFFLPTEAAGQVALGSEVRVVLDTAPHLPIPATVTFVSRQGPVHPQIRGDSQ